MVASAAIDQMCGSTLDCFHDLDQRNDRPASAVELRCEDHVNMVGHDHCDSEAISAFVIMHAGSQNDVPSPVRKFPTKLGAEGDEMWRAVALHMGQIATIELHPGILAQLVKLLAYREEKIGPEFPN